MTEQKPDATSQGAGSILEVDSTHRYADLDELIVNHVQATARRVEELMAHEKFKHGTEDDLRELSWGRIQPVVLTSPQTFS